MNTQPIQSLNPQIANQHIELPLPHLRLMDISDAVALMLPSLPKGDLPVLCNINDSIRKIGSVRRSALVISKLMKISRVVYCTPELEHIELKDSMDILKVLEVPK